MRRFVINSLAVVGAVTLLSALAGFVYRTFQGDAFGTVVDANGQPLANIAVFLDRGHRTVERFATDAAGHIRLPIADHDVAASVWLICVPDGVPIIDRQDPRERRSVTYSFTRLSGVTYGEYRAYGWRGPIPRECPASEREPYLWAYPGVGTVYETEPEWPQAPSGISSRR